MSTKEALTNEITEAPLSIFDAEYLTQALRVLLKNKRCKFLKSYISIPHKNNTLRVKALNGYVTRKNLKRFFMDNEFLVTGKTITVDDIDNPYKQVANINKQIK